MTRPCSKCGAICEPAKSKTTCRPCTNKAHYEWRQNNKQRWQELKQRYQRKKRNDPEWVEARRKAGREYWAGLRHEAVMAYGGYICACCGETEPLFLSIDHVNNDGAEHRRQLGYDGNGKGGGSRTMKWLKDSGYPEGFQVLCMNCNHGKARNGGVCPHSMDKVSRKAVVVS